MLLKFFKKHGWKYIPGILFLIINSKIQTLGPEALGKAIGMLGADPMPAAEAIYRQAAVIFGIAVAVFVTRFIWRMFIIMNARVMESFLREELYIKIQSLPLSFFSKQRSGDMMAYAVNDVNAVRQIFGPALAMGGNGIITATIAVYQMFTRIDMRLTLAAIPPIPAVIILIIILGKIVRKRSLRVQKAFSDLSGFVNEAIMGERIIKAFAGEERWLKNFGSMSGEMRVANVKLADTQSVINPAVLIAFGLSYAVSLIYGGSLVAAGRIELESLVTFLGYLLLIQTPVVFLGHIVNIIYKGIASYKRICAITSAQSVPEFENRQYNEKIEGAVECRNLTFSYPGAALPALKDINFSIKAGQTLGIAGATGSGKTTLVSLLLKLYKVPPGTVFIDGKDINTIPARAIREECGYVPQDGFLFSASIRENIEFYAPGAGTKETLEAAEKACVKDEIEEFQDGFDTEVGERGTHLSGGQKQRISLARALVRNPAILILDDTLSAVDNITERKIVENLNGVLHDKTSIVISHRLSALESADMIIYLKNGEIAECGTHDELVALGGEYAATWRSQLSGEGRRGA